MKRSDNIRRQLQKYGSPVTVTPKNGSPIAVQAMIQPLRVRRMPDSDAIGIVGGDKEKDGMLYIGPVDCRLDQFPRGTTVQEDTGIMYRVVNARCVLLGSAPLYVWAILQQTAQEGS
ncbi:MAG: hypothetical protein PUC32_03545 [Oscillospiraceae bacterium]|nr:hypothetical protein [Oscillospiraceae bacterium]